MKVIEVIIFVMKKEEKVIQKKESLFVMQRRK